MVTSLSNKPLSAKQGVELKAQIDKKVSRISNPVSVAGFYAEKQKNGGTALVYGKTAYSDNETYASVPMRGTSDSSTHPGTFEISHPEMDSSKAAYSDKHPLTVGVANDKFAKKDEYVARHINPDTIMKVYAAGSSADPVDKMLYVKTGYALTEGVDTIALRGDMKDNKHPGTFEINHPVMTEGATGYSAKHPMTVGTAEGRYSKITDLTEGNLTVAKAASATQATQDGNGNNILETYVDKESYEAKVAELVEKYNALGEEIKNLVLGQIPIATHNTVGGIKVGYPLSITDDGTLSVDLAYCNPTNATDSSDGIISGHAYDILQKAIFDNVIEIPGYSSDGNYSDYALKTAAYANCATGLEDKLLSEYITSMLTDIEVLQNRSVLPGNLRMYNYSGYEYDCWWEVELVSNGIYVIQYDMAAGILVNRVDSTDDKPGVVLGKYVAYYDTQAKTITITEDGVRVTDPKPIYVMKLAQATLLS